MGLDDEDQSPHATESSYMQIIESCPTPRLFDHLDGGSPYGGGAGSPYSTTGGFDPYTDLNFGVHGQGAQRQNYMADGLIAQSRQQQQMGGTLNTFGGTLNTFGGPMGGTMNTFAHSSSSSSGRPWKPPEARLAPGESIDEKLREWIEASQRLLDPNSGY